MGTMTFSAQPQNQTKSCFVFPTFALVYFLSHPQTASSAHFHLDYILFSPLAPDWPVCCSRGLCCSYTLLSQYLLVPAPCYLSSLILFYLFTCIQVWILGLCSTLFSSDSSYTLRLSRSEPNNCSTIISGLWLISQSAVITCDASNTHRCVLISGWGDSGSQMFSHWIVLFSIVWQPICTYLLSMVFRFLQGSWIENVCLMYIM